MNSIILRQTRRLNVRNRAPMRHSFSSYSKPIFTLEELRGKRSDKDLPKDHTRGYQGKTNFIIKNTEKIRASWDSKDTEASFFPFKKRLDTEWNSDLSLVGYQPFPAMDEALHQELQDDIEKRDKAALLRWIQSDYILHMDAPTVRKIFPIVDSNLTVKQYQRLISILGLNGAGNDALHLYKAMKSYGLVPNSKIYAAVVLGLENPKAVMAIHRFLRSNHPDLYDNLLVRSLIYSLSKIAEPVLLIHPKGTEDRVTKPNSPQYIDIVSSKLYENLENIWTDLTATNLVFSLDTYCAFAHGFSLCKTPSVTTHITQIFTLMTSRAKHNPWNWGHYKTLVEVFQRIGDSGSVYRVYKAALKTLRVVPENDMLEIMYLDACLRQGEYKKLGSAVRKRIAEPHLTKEMCDLAIDYAIAVKDIVFLNRCARAMYPHIQRNANVEVKRASGDDVYISPLVAQSQLQPVMLGSMARCLNAMASLGSLEDTINLFRKYKEIRAVLIPAQNKLKNAPYTQSEMTEAFLTYKAPGSKEILSTIRKWNTVSVPRNVVVDMITVHMKHCHGDFNVLRDFLKDYLNEMFEYHWARYLANHDTKLMQLGESIDKELSATRPQPNSRGRDQRNQQVTSRSELKKSKSWVNRRLQRGVVLKVGSEGPFGILYVCLDDMYRRFSGAWGDEIDVLKFDELVYALEDYERELARTSRLSGRLMIPTKDDVGEDVDPEEGEFWRRQEVGGGEGVSVLTVASDAESQLGDGEKDDNLRITEDVERTPSPWLQQSSKGKEE